MRHKISRVFSTSYVITSPYRCTPVYVCSQCTSGRKLHQSITPLFKDPRLSKLGRVIEDDFEQLLDKYDSPQNPVILSHGLFGFDTYKVMPKFHWIPAIEYWRGINTALRANNVEVFATSVPPSASVEERAEALAKCIHRMCKGRSVNIIGHSMGGIDARYMISRLRPTSFKVLSLTTIATPHQGSPFADYCLEFIGKERLPRIYETLKRVGLQSGAFEQLTTKFMKEDFNPKTPDIHDVRYYSYGSVAEPSIFSPFRIPHRIIYDIEGPNDGLVSVESSVRGEYKGTIIGPTHLEIINWTNRLKWILRGLIGQRNHFNAVAFYLSVTDMLKKDGL